MAPPVHENIYPDVDAEGGFHAQEESWRPNIASKEWWVRQYDHEVIAQSVIKPFCGVNHDAPRDAAVIAPFTVRHEAVVSCGIVLVILTSMPMRDGCKYR